MAKLKPIVLFMKMFKLAHTNILYNADEITWMHGSALVIKNRMDVIQIHQCFSQVWHPKAGFVNNVLLLFANRV